MSYFPSLPIRPARANGALLVAAACYVLLGTLGVASTAQAACPDNGLIGYWPLNGDGDDASGCGPDGTVNGAAPTADQGGNPDSALLFDGVNDYIDLGNSAALRPSLPVTISAYLRNDCPISSNCWIFENDASPSTYVGVSFAISGGHGLYAQYGSGGGASSVTRRSGSTVTVLTPGAWHHVAVVIAGPTDFRFYVDGARLSAGQVVLGGSGGSMVYSGANARIGLDQGVFNAPFDGVLDEVRFYDRALSDGEVAALGPCVEDGLLGHWPMDGDATDATACGNDGTVNGAVLTTDEAGTPNSAYDFDGVDDSIDLGSSDVLKPQLPLTLSMWVRNDCAPAAICELFYSDAIGGAYTGVRFYIQGNGALAVRYGDGGGTTSADRRTALATTPLTPGVWQQVAVVIRGPTDFQFFVDGVLDTGVTYSGTGGTVFPISYPGGPVLLGDAGSAFDGGIDDVRLHARALAPGEIVAFRSDSCVGPNGLVGHWPIVGNAADVSPCMNDGVVSGATLTPDLYGNVDGAYDFDGVDDIIDLGNAAHLKPALPVTIALWVRNDCAPGTACEFFSNDRSLGFYSGVRFYQLAIGALGARFGAGLPATSATRRSAVATTVLTPGAWQHVAVVIRGPTDFEFYVDGVPDAVSSYSGTGGPLGYLGGDALIGGTSDGGALVPHTGPLDDIRFYDRALSPSEVADLVAITCGNYIVHPPTEECDDGNILSEDGCSDVCVAEFCGDDVVQAGLGENCDDGNMSSEDGCSDMCIVEFCGDGVLQAGLSETCDDGNTTPYDGCSATCVSETAATVIGSAAGGTIDYTIAGVIVSITTTAGQTSSQIASALAAAINGNGTLSGMGIGAGATGDQLFHDDMPGAFEGTESDVALATTLDSLLGDLSVIPRTLDFELLADGQSVLDISTLEGITFGYSLSGETALATDSFDTESPTKSLGLTGGDEAFLDGDTLSFTLPRPVLALGMYVVTSDPAAADEILLVTPQGTSGNVATPIATLADGGYVYFIAHIAAVPFTTATLDFTADGATNFVWTLDDVTAAVPTVGMTMYLGIATGGALVGVTVDGVFISLTTAAGQTAAQVAQALAAAINADATLKAAGTAAAAVNGDLLTNGTITAETNDDTGLGGTPQVPGLGPLALMLLTSAIAGAGVRMIRRRR